MKICVILRNICYLLKTLTLKFTFKDTSEVKNRFGFSGECLDTIRYSLPECSRLISTDKC